MRWRTSATDPLRIDSVSVPGNSARIGMTICPGKKYPWGRHGAWHRDLGTDLAVIEDWGAHTLISLIEDHEFEALEVTGLGQAAQARGLVWRHWPVGDPEIPDARFEACWEAENRHHRKRPAGRPIDRVALYGRAGAHRHGRGTPANAFRIAGERGSSACAGRSAWHD